MTTFTRRIADARRGPRARVHLATLLLPPMLLAAIFFAAFNGGNDNGDYPNLSISVAGVTCATAHDVTNEFTQAVHDATLVPPDYSGVKKFGFAAPLYPADINPLQGLLRARLDQLNAEVKAVDAGTCTDTPTASIVDSDGQTITLPIVVGSQPDNPIVGSQSNEDSRTVPVTVGSAGNTQRTNTWSELNDLFGSTQWYTDCASTNLDMNWNTDVPKFEATEDGHDNRFIVAINVDSKWSDDQIRQKAASDGNPNVGNLPIVRTASIINTRHLGDKRCDDFIHTQSQVRVSLGKPVFNADGSFKTLDTTEGIFVDCHNMWRLPKSAPVPTPVPTAPPSHPRTPGTTPPHTPPTTQPPTCTNGGVPPKCLTPKDGNAGAAHQGNVPTQVQGTNPPATPNPEPRPTNPPATYQSPAPPPPPHTSAPPRTTPPPETQPSDPATGQHCAPGITTC